MKKLFRVSLDPLWDPYITGESYWHAPYHAFRVYLQAQNLVPTFDMFNLFYYISVNVGIYLFNSRTGNVLPYGKDPPKSLHDWKHVRPPTNLKHSNPDRSLDTRM
ncbi:hypothetical protein Hanom_Chr15g01407951 [Helianthus anomalus]